MPFSRLSLGILSIAEVLFPTCCPACGQKLLSDEEVMCRSCLGALPRTEHAILADNGIDMLFAELIASEKHVVRYDRGGTFSYYNRQRGKTLRRLIEQGKFGMHPRPEIFYALGREAARDFVDSALFSDIDMLVPVPLHPRRLRQRGFNQAEYICRGLASVMHIPIDTDHLIRLRNNPHQSKSLLSHRMQNVEGLFAVLHPEEWKNKHILLVDDVITSGATMLSCMRMLTPIRRCRASVFALGWAHN